jgi:ABC-type uncharacterized transport system auxiliary subunit
MTRFYLILFLSIMMCTAGCMSKKKVIYTKYYLITPPEMKVDHNSDSARLKYTLQIGPVEISPAYASSRIVSRAATNEIDYFRYHEWAVPPKVSIQEFAISYFMAKGLFKEVSDRITNARPDFKLAINVQQLEMLELKEEPLVAHLAVQYRFIDNLSGEVLFRHNMDDQITLNERDINELARKISELMLVSLEEVESKIDGLQLERPQQ